MGKMGDVCFIKIGQIDHKVEWLVRSVYMNCEGVRNEENIMKLECIKRSGLEDVLGIRIGGDMHAHICELDGCENEIGQRMVHRREEVYTGLCVYGWTRHEESCECQRT